MFWTILFWVYIGISALTFIMAVLASISVTAQVKQELCAIQSHTDQTETLINTIVVCLRVLLVSILPILNLGLLCSYLFHWNEIIIEAKIRVMKQYYEIMEDDNEH